MWVHCAIAPAEEVPGSPQETVRDGDGVRSPRGVLIVGLEGGASRHGLQGHGGHGELNGILQKAKKVMLVRVEE